MNYAEKSKIKIANLFFTCFYQSMKVYNINPQINSYRNNTSQKTTNPAFKGLFGTNALTSVHIGSKPNGFIGKIRVKTADNKEALLNVIKNRLASGQETYIVQDTIGRKIAEMDIKFKRNTTYEYYEMCGDKTYVEVELLRNYSRPDTNYTNPSLKHYKGVGTRLIQIAQRRSDEADCQGNIHLKSKDSAKPFYKSLGFEFIPLHPYCGYETQNQMYLPPSAKEPLSRRNGGL